MKPQPQLGAAFAIPLEIAVFIVLGLLGGLWVDRQFHSFPWGVLVGLALGLAGALRAVIRVVRLADRGEAPGAKDSDLKPEATEPTDPVRPPGRPEP